MNPDEQLRGPYFPLGTNHGPRCRLCDPASTDHTPVPHEMRLKFDASTNRFADPQSLDYIPHPDLSTKEGMDAYMLSRRKSSVAPTPVGRYDQDVYRSAILIEPFGQKDEAAVVCLLEQRERDREASGRLLDFLEAGRKRREAERRERNER